MKNISGSAESDEAEKRYYIRQFLLKILQHSTAMPFRWHSNVFRCFHCQLRFHLAIDLKQHYQSHSDVNLHKCFQKCDIRHQVKLDIVDLKCKRCDAEFSTLNDFVIHLNEKHEENCSLEHLKHIDCFKLSDGCMKCLICDESFAFFGPLLLHTLRVHRRKGVVCETCGLNFTSKCGLSRHILSTHAIESFKCRKCDKKFLAVHRRDDHENRIHDIKKRKCHICLKVLGSVHKRDTHLATAHNYKSSEYKCENCSKVFRFQNQLMKHNRRVHLKEKKKVCHVCGDRFFDNHLLGLHMIRHSDEKPFECDICSKKFPRKRALNIHYRIHTNDKRCVCKLCGQAFVQTASLKFHMRAHHGVGKT